jgi:basic amino acid/polyamine antiporter, APA family
MSSSKPGLFAREATGLVREIGFSVGVIIILSHVIGLGWQKRAFQFSGPMPMPTDTMPLGLPAMFWAFLVVGLVVLVTGYAAGYVAAAMPRSGGGYVTVSRIIHPSVGYLAGWLMFLAEAFSYGLIGVAVFEGIGIFFNIALASPGVTPPAWLSAMGDPLTIFVGGLLLVWIFALVALLGTKMYGRLMQVMFYVPAAITILFFAMWIAGALNPQVVIDGFTKVTGGSPDTFVQTALATGMADNPAGFFDAFSFALGGAFWAYMGWYATTFLAGEVKEANKKLPRVLLVAGLVIILVYLSATSLSAVSVLNVGVTQSGGHTWSLFQAYGWLSYGGVDRAAISAAGITNFQSAWSTGIATIIAQGMGLGWLAVIIAIGAVFWVANDIPPFLLVASRTFFAMSFDRMMPEKFSYVSERWHAPVWSLIITAVFAIPACMAEANWPTGAATTLAFAGVVGTDIFDALFLLMFCVSCMLLPLERRDIYDRAAVKHSVGFVVFLGLLATLGASFCLYIFIQQSPWIWALFTSSASYGDIASSVGFLACIAAGVVLYVYHMYRNSTRGVDMRTLYIAIPPE